MASLKFYLKMSGNGIKISIYLKNMIETTSQANVTQALTF